LSGITRTRFLRTSKASILSNRNCFKLPVKMITARLVFDHPSTTD
jgi:hypothetical protein